MSQLRTAVLGAGKMGRLHSRICREMEHVELIGIVDTDLPKAQALAEQFETAAFRDTADIIDRVDAVTVAVPTQFHEAVAMPFIERGIPVLIEKPLAGTLEQARQLMAAAQRQKCIVQVGYSERFNPVVQAMHRLHIRPRFMEAQRVSPYTFRSTDIGVVLDIMIHDIDIVLSMAHSEIIDIQAVGVNVLGRHEDIANVRLSFANGCVANLTASRLALKTERKIRVFSEDAYLSLDYLKKTGVMIRKTENLDMVKLLREQTQDGELDLTTVDWTKLVHVENLVIDDKEPLRLEQEAFLQAVKDGSRPQVSAEDAVAAMELAERIIKTLNEHRWDGQAPAAISAQQWQ